MIKITNSCYLSKWRRSNLYNFELDNLILYDFKLDTKLLYNYKLDVVNIKTKHIKFERKHN